MLFRSERWKFIRKRQKWWHGYLTTIWLATVWAKLLPGWSRRVSLPPPVSSGGIGKRLISCSPTKNTLDGYCSRKLSAPALLKLKIMASWIGISTPTLMKPLFLTRCSWQCNRRNSPEPKNLKSQLPWISYFNDIWQIAQGQIAIRSLHT